MQSIGKCDHVQANFTFEGAPLTKNQTGRDVHNLRSGWLFQHAMLATYCNQRSPKRHYVSTPICQAPIYHKRAQEACKHGMTIGLLLKSIWQYLPDDRMKSVSVHAIIHTLGEKPLIRKTMQGFLVECVCRIK